MVEEEIYVALEGLPRNITLFPAWTEKYRYKGKYPIIRYVDYPKKVKVIWLGDEEGAIAFSAHFILLWSGDVWVGQAVADIRTHKDSLIIDTWMKDYTKKYVA